MKLLIDNCLSPAHAEALNVLARDKGNVVEHLRNKFPPNTTDEAWLTTLEADGGWAVLTSDAHIATKPNERAAWLGRSVVVFFVPRSWSQLRLYALHLKLIAAMEHIEQAFESAKPGTGFRIRMNGRVSRVT